MKFHRFKYLVIIIVSLFAYSCGRIGEGKVANATLIPLKVTADLETEALKNPSKYDDAADDPAVWINKDNPEQSYIIGTDKTAGLAVYNLEGKQLYFYPDGKMNNVDVRYEFPYNGKNIDIVACSNRSSRSLNFYRIHKNGSLTKLPIKGFNSPMEKNVYGFALGTNNGRYYAFVNSKRGEVVQWELSTIKDTVVGKIVRQLDLGKQLEGMVADDVTNTLFIGAEEQAIWHTSITPSKETPRMIKSSELTNNIYMKKDIEGLAIYRTKEHQYLLASSQGNFSYAVFDLKPPYNYLGSFRIVDGIVDGVEETDGIEAVSVTLGVKYPDGIFIAQDGFNKDGKRSKTQNFKVVSWTKIQSLINNKMTK